MSLNQVPSFRLTIMMPTIRSRSLRNLEEVVKDSITDIQAVAAPRQERVARRPFVEMTESDFVNVLSKI